jgi:predicted permease
VSKRWEARLDAELRDHFERDVAERVRAGASEAEARREARLAFGGIEQVKEAVREVRPGIWLAQLGQDLRYGWRSLRRSPGFTVIVVLTLALGLGANTAIFSLADAILLRPLPVRAPERLVLLAVQDGSNGRGPHPPGRLKLLSYPLYQRVLADNQGPGAAFAALAAEQSGGTTSSIQWSGRPDDSAETVAGRSVTANYFEVLGVAPFRGRLFAAGDATAPGANPVLVLSHHLWRRRFGGDPRLLGARVTVNGRAYNVVGIAPPGFTGTNLGMRTDFWVPITMQAELMVSESRLDRAIDWWLLAVGRLAPGVTPVEAEARVNVSLQQFLAGNPRLVERDSRPQAIRAVLEPAAQGVPSVRRVAREPLLTLLAGVALLLLIAYVNISHLLLARAGQRRREMGIRAALGAGPARLARQLLAEGLLLSALGVGLAVLVTPLLRGGLLALVPGEPVLNVSTDVRVAAFVATLALLTVMLLGLVPAWHAVRANLQQHLRTGSLTVRGAGALPGRLLMVSQVALSVLLLVGAGLLARTLQRLRVADKGFDEQHLLVLETNFRVVSPDLRLARVPAGDRRDQVTQLYDEMLRRVSALPGVRSASLSVHGLLSGSGWHHDLLVPGSKPPQKLREVGTNGVSAGYFETVGMQLVRGRGFTAADHQHAPRVAVLNEALARRLFPGAEALGRRFGDTDAGEIEVVGVVRDARIGGVRREAPPTYFAPIAQQDHFGTTLEVRASGDPAALGQAVRAAVSGVHAALPVVYLRTMRGQVERTLSGERLLATLSGAFGLTALLLVCLGLYGVVSRWAVSRTPEIGLRMALGQTPAGVRRMVLRRALGVVLVGLLVGVPAAVASGRLLRGLLYQLDPLDPATLCLATGLLLLVAATAAYLPARRASRVDPMQALRAE